MVEAERETWTEKAELNIFICTNLVEARSFKLEELAAVQFGTIDGSCGKDYSCSNAEKMQVDEIGEYNTVICTKPIEVDLEIDNAGISATEHSDRNSLAATTSTEMLGAVDESLLETALEIAEDTVYDEEDGKKPQLILTDQDSAMRNAISLVFPDAFHRFCIWHILKNLRENMSSYMAEREGMEDIIVGLIMDSLTIVEFETGWTEMVATYGCVEHDHIKRMWEARTMFVPAYFKKSFYPFTRTTGRSESFNSNFKDYVLRKDTIENFLKPYELFQENAVVVENEDRFQSIAKIHVFWGNQPIERHVASIYTKGIYLKFVTELLNSTTFGVTEVVRDKVYELKKLFQYEKPVYRRNLFTVFADCEKMTFECECGKYEKDGILCCHILRIFTQFDVVRIPEDYIMPRWTTKFREKELLKHKVEIVEVHGNEKSKNSLHYAMLMNDMNDVCVDISRDASKSKEFLEEVHKLHACLMSDKVPHDTDGAKSLVLKDPSVIQRASSIKSKEKESEESSVAETTVDPIVNSVHIWVNEDGTISRPEKVLEIAKKTKTTRKPKGKEVLASSSLSDPPVSNSKSVIKGNRLKPQSEKNSTRKKSGKKKNGGSNLKFRINQVFLEA
ncbi:hypothetical protein ACQ4PT_032126 [Festuca glaucescens]